MFANRRDAGRQLADALRGLQDPDPVVIGLPRGGVAVAAEVAERLGAPLDIIVVRKLGYPRQPELGLGALAEGGVRVINEALVQQLGITPARLEEVTAHESAELSRRVRHYRGDTPPLDVRGRNVIVVDDGLATGFTARAGMVALRQRGATRIVLAVPVAAEAEATALGDVADEVVAVMSLSSFFAIGEAYADFSQTTDDEVVALLRRSGGR